MAYPTQPLIRSLFFMPANRADLVRKLARAAADCSVLDLEDGTPPDDKARARAVLAESVAAARADGYTGRLLVRVNEPASPHYPADIEAALDSGADGVLIPKLESREQLFPALHRLHQLGDQGDGKWLAAGIETARGVLNIESLCAPEARVAMVYFGAEDFAADMGGQRTGEGNEVLYARSRVVLAARAYGVIAIDQAVADVRNDELYRRDAQVGRNLGYHGKMCVIPRQLQVCHEVFSPGEAAVAAARRTLAAYAEAVARNIGTIEFEGKLIDGPMLKRAEAIVAMAEQIAGAAPATANAGAGTKPKATDSAAPTAHHSPAKGAA